MIVSAGGRPRPLDISREYIYVHPIRLEIHCHFVRRYTLNLSAHTPFPKEYSGPFLEKHMVMLVVLLTIL